MPGLTVSGHAWGGRSGDRFIVYNTEKPSQVYEMHLVHMYKATLRGPAGGENVFLKIDRD